VTGSIDDLPEGLFARPLTEAGAEGGFALSSEARWNQTLADWRFLLRDGEGIGIAEKGGALVGTAILFAYPPSVGWISMVLVTGRWRKRALASRMMRWGIERLQSRRLVPVLDATPAGREVYRRLGFSDGPAITRMEASTAPLAGATGEAEIAPLDIGEVLAVDHDVFGADRNVVLDHLQARVPTLALAARKGGRLVGYGLARDGRVAHQIGPIVAADAGIALALLAAARARLGAGPAFLDVFDGDSDFRHALDRASYRVQRPYTRMALDNLPPSPAGEGRGGGSRRKGSALAGLRRARPPNSRRFRCSRSEARASRAPRAMLRAARRRPSRLHACHHRPR
jgi:GNAT superfamily N-acetyltransferase